MTTTTLTDDQTNTLFRYSRMIGVGIDICGNCGSDNWRYTRKTGLYSCDKCKTTLIFLIAADESPDATLEVMIKEHAEFSGMAFIGHAEGRHGFGGVRFLELV